MKDDLENQTLLKRYLLGELITEENELRRIEERLLIDDSFFQELQITEEELIDDYINKNLNEVEREGFETYFLLSPERQQKLRFAIALQKQIAENEKVKDNPKVIPFPFWRKVLDSQPLRIAATILILMGVSFGVWYAIFHKRQTDEHQAEIEKGMFGLIASYQNHRPTEARITGFKYAPLSSTRGTEGQGKADLAPHRKLELQLLETTEDGPSAKAHHDLGRYYLSQKDFDNAIEQFEKALKLDPNNAQIYSDLGATFLEKAKISTEVNLETLAKSLENLKKALELNSSLLEALFNKALCLQKQSLWEEASEAWRQYLEKDSTSKWADEAKNNLQIIQEKKAQARGPKDVLNDFLEAYRRKDDERAWTIVSQTKEMITGTMVPIQLTQKIVEDETQSRKESLSALLYAGELEKKKTGDPYFFELAEYYEAFSDTQRDTLKQAQDLMIAGYKSCLKSDFKAAVSQFEKAKDLFSKASDNLEVKLADFWIGYSLSRLPSIKASTSLLMSLLTYCEKKNYKWLLSQTLWWLADNYFVQSQYSKAIQYDVRALEISQEISDTYHQQKVLSQLANIHSRLGDSGKAISYIQKSLFLDTSYFYSLRQNWRNYLFTAQVLYGLKLYEAAVFYSREGFQTASNRLDSQDDTRNSYLYLALMNGGIGNYNEAIHFAKKSQRMAQNQLQKISLADSTRQIAHLYRGAENCKEALKNYDQVIQTYYQPDFSDYTIHKYDAHKGRLLCYLSQNDKTAFEKELSVVLSLFEEHRSQIFEEEIRNAFFDNEQGVYDIAIDYANSQQNFRQAFEYSEKSKARSLLDLMSNEPSADSSQLSKEIKAPNESRSLSLSEIQAKMSEQTQIVQYALLQNKMLVWVISKDKFTPVERKIEFEKVNAQIAAYIDLLAENVPNKKDEIDKQAIELYELLITPIQQHLDKKKEISIIPDKVLNRLAFTSLISPKTRKYIIDDYTLSSSPSSTVFVLCSEIALQRESISNEKLLSVGNPSFDRNANPDLQDLPAAEKEAKEIATNYDLKTTLMAKEATEEKFLAKMRDANIIHFAGHYVVDENSPFSSRLLLADSEFDKGASGLTTYKLFNSKLHQPKLVVLSACQTGVERYYNGEGMIGAARTFLAMRAPLIVASQWLVDSDATTELMIRFHNYRKREKLSTTAALRKAQLDMLKNADERFHQPYYWAAFLPIGGYARY